MKVLVFVAALLGLSAAARPEFCSLPSVKGQCRAAMPRFFFNPSSGRCEHFIYGGCGGNQNNFEDKSECEVTCVDQDVCDEEPKQQGMCMAYMPRFSYNPETKTCERFIYGGCGGNGNNFDDEYTCRSICVKQEPHLIGNGLDACYQPMVVGPCRAAMPRFYYNATTHNCTLFYYGGCNQNENNFETQHQCRSRCMRGPIVAPRPPRCYQEPKKNGGPAIHPYYTAYSYNATTNQCEYFLFGGNGGNDNRFNDYNNCRLTCVR